MQAQATEELPRRFHSNPAVYTRYFRSLTIVLGGLIVAATVFGQVRAGRFPAYQDLALAFAIPAAAFVALAALVHGAVKFFPIRLGPAGIKGHDIIGRSRLVRWSEIQAAQPHLIEGIPHILVRTPGRSDPLIIPLWLDDLPGFAAVVKEYAGPANALTRVLADL